MAEGFEGVEDLIQCEAVGDQCSRGRSALTPCTPRLAVTPALDAYLDEIGDRIPMVAVPAIGSEDPCGPAGRFH
jgi:hypothetical protein